MEKHIVKHAHFKERVIFDEGIFCRGNQKLLFMIMQKNTNGIT